MSRIRCLPHLRSMQEIPFYLSISDGTFSHCETSAKLRPVSYVRLSSRTATVLNSKTILHVILADNKERLLEMSKAATDKNLHIGYAIWPVNMGSDN
jgi:hypothetical protein